MIGGGIGSFSSEDIVQIRKILDDAERQHKDAIAELSYCDKKQEDILHEMELVDHKYHDVAKLGVELTDIRRRRRAAKNAIDLLDPIIKWRQEQAGPLTKLQTVLGTMRKLEERQNNLIYHKKTGDEGDIIAHRGQNNS